MPDASAFPTVLGAAEFGCMEVRARARGELTEKQQDKVLRRKRTARRMKRFLLMVALPVTVIGVALYMYANGGRYIVTENAYVKANVIAVSADVTRENVSATRAVGVTQFIGKPFETTDVLTALAKALRIEAGSGAERLAS